MREGSKDSKLFNEIDKKVAEKDIPSWISWDPKNKELSVKSGSFEQNSELLFDLGQVIEYYQR